MFCAFHLEKHRQSVNAGLCSCTCCKINQAVADCEVPSTCDCLGNSKDMNPIKLLWSYTKRKLRGVDTSLVPKLEARIKKLWAGFSQSTWETLHPVSSNTFSMLQRERPMEINTNLASDTCLFIHILQP